MTMRGNRSANIIARLLGTEGYSDYAHNQVERYWKRVCMDKQRRRNVKRIEEEFSELMKEASAADRLLIGKFISLRAQMSFDAGLRIGLQAFAHSVDHEVFRKPRDPMKLNGERHDGDQQP